jgi:predicted nucleotidyltransferase
MGAVTSIRPNHGVFADEHAALAAVITRLREALDPKEIWLFGSRARGAGRPDSDFDSLVVAKRGGAFGSDDYELVDAPLNGCGVGCDVVPCSSEDFEDGAALPTSFVARILSEGRKLYDAGSP